MTPLAFSRRTLRIHETDLDVATLQRDGNAEPIVFLHGFGSTKEDYADISLHSRFDDHPVLAWDAPGCGVTECSRLDRISIGLLIDTAVAMVDAAGYERFHLVGHSMGGLTSLMLADRIPERVLSFTNIEGNVASEDCFLSRQIDQLPDDDCERFLQRFIKRVRQSPAFASSLYAASLPHKVRAQAVPGIFRSMVDLSDNGDLMHRFLKLRCPKMFMYGEQNQHLSYLPHLARHSVRLACITQCGHFPMYSNPPGMWNAIAKFLQFSKSQAMSL